jgi:hypothetical protein
VSSELLPVSSSVMIRIGPSSPTAPAAEEQSSEVRVQQARVAQDRHQRADRGRRHRRAGQQARDDDAGRVQDAGEAVGEHQREAPTGHREPQRPAADPLEVDLISREQEQEREPERPEERRELVDLGQAEHLRTDQDPEQKLDDDERERDHPPDESGEQRRNHRRHHDQEEEGDRDLHGAARSVPRCTASMDVENPGWLLPGPGDTVGPPSTTAGR